MGPGTPVKELVLIMIASSSLIFYWFEYLYKGTKSTAELLDERGHNDDQTSSAEKALQSKAFSTIADILIDAGYFRARIATLSEFDKVTKAAAQRLGAPFRCSYFSC
jgi:hypothetical protein